MKEPRGAQIMKCEGHLTFNTHRSPFASEAKEAVLSALWPISSYGFVCHKKCEFNPIRVAGVC